MLNYTHYYESVEINLVGACYLAEGRSKGGCGSAGMSVKRWLDEKVAVLVMTRKGRHATFQHAMYMSTTNCSNG